MGRLVCLSIPTSCSHQCVKTYHTAYTTCLPENEPMRFEICRGHQKLNINLENCAFRWFVLYILNEVIPLCTDSVYSLYCIYISVNTTI